MAEKVRVGIVGASVSGGWATRAHLPALAHLGDIQLQAVATTRQETADASAREFGAKRGYANHKDLAADPEVDLVAVVVKAPAHYEPVIAAIEAGKHVYCEWPLGANLREAEEMAFAARAKGIVTAIGLQARLDPTLNTMKQLIDEGYIGDVLAVHMTYIRAGQTARPGDRLWQKDVEKGATTLTIAGGHAIDALTYAVGEFDEVSARVSTMVKQWLNTDTNEMVDVTAPDNVLVSGKLKNGAMASIHVAAQPFHGEGFRMDVWGAKGALTIFSQEGVNMGGATLMGSQGNAPLVNIPDREEFVYVSEGMPKGAPFNIGQVYARTVDAIAGGSPMTAGTFEDALKTHKLLDAIQRSSDEGRSVKVG